MNEFTSADIRGAGAVADGLTDNAEAIQKVIDRLAAGGGGRVLVPAGGVFLSGGLELRAGIELHLERGAILRASPDISAHCSLGEIGGNYIAGLKAGQRHEARCFIHASRARGIAITGGGEIDGNARAYVIGDAGHILEMTPDRPRLIFLERCDDLLVRDLTIRDAAMWSLHPVGCERVLIDGVTILNNLKVPNCDGIDPDHCRHVRIANCHIEAGDDGIVFKNHVAFADCGPCENITVVNCTIVSTSCAIKIGTEGHGDFRNITIGNCVIDRSNRGLGIQLRDWGCVENVLFHDIVIRTRLFGDKWWGKAEPIAVTTLPRRNGERPGYIRGVCFRNIRAEGEGGILVIAQEGAVVEDLVFERVSMNVVRSSRHEAGWRDLRPVAGEEHRGCVRSHLSAFLLENLGRVELSRCEVSWQNAGEEAPAAWRHAVEACGVTELLIEGFRGKSAAPQYEALAGVEACTGLIESESN